MVYTNEFFMLSEEEFQIVVDGLEALKSKDFGAEIMMTVFDSMFEKNLTPEQKQIKKEKDEEQRQNKQEEKKVMVKKIDVVKSKLILSRSSITRAE